jgi:hypothetical protein
VPLRLECPGGVRRREEIIRLKGLELLGKHLGLFTDKVEHSGSFSIAAEMEEARQRVIIRTQYRSRS